MLAFFCIFLVIAVAHSQPTREQCCTPEQWEGSAADTVGFAMESGTDAMMEYMRLHVDHTGKRVAATGYQHFERSGHRRHFQVIDNWETHKRIFVEDGECHITNLSGEMTSNCIHESHGHVGTYHIGAGEEILEVDAWDLPPEYTREEIHLRTIRLGEMGCVPYQYRRIFVPTEAEAGHPAFASFHSYNRITPGIADDSVFHTPEECQTVDKIELPLVIEESLNVFRK